MSSLPSRFWDPASPEITITFTKLVFIRIANASIQDPSLFEVEY